MTRKGRVRLLKTGVWLACLTPLAWMGYQLFLGGNLGVNPTETMERWSGRTVLVLLLVTLAITPLRGLTGWNDLQKLRRLVGLFAFFWVVLHFLAWMGLDQLFQVRYIGADIVERPYILVGTLSFLLLLPLAVTSTKGWIRRLGRKWVVLHRLVYPAALLGVLHYFWITKADDRLPLLALGAWLVLMTLRLPFMDLRGRRTPPAGGGRQGSPDPTAGESVAD